MKTMTLLRFKYACIISFPLAIFFLYLWMALLADLRLSVPELIGISAGVIIILTLSLFLFQKIKLEWSSGFIIMLAAIFRAMFLLRSPELSDDIYRYLFDGLMLLSGRNPYAASPSDVLADNLPISNLIHLINHANLPSIYPPAAQLVFAAGAFLGGVSGMKLILVFLDILTCILILRILAALGLPRINAVLYAWHPLPIIEISASGHMDAAPIFFLFLTLVFLLPNKEKFSPENSIKIKARAPSYFFGFDAVCCFFSGIFFAAAVLTKLVPLIFLPGVLMLTPSGKRKYFLSGFIVSSIAMIGAFWPEVQNSFYTLSIYIVNWEFAGFFFRCLRVVSGSGTIARIAITAIFAAAAGIIYVRYIKAARVLAQLHSKIPLNPPLGKGGFLRPLLQRREEEDSIRNKPIGYFDINIFKSFYTLSMTFLFLTPTLHPWYALYLAVLLPFAAGPSGIVFSWSILLAYRVVILYGLTGRWIENDVIPFLVVSAPAAAFGARIIAGMATPKSTKSDKSQISTHLYFF